MAEIIVRYPNTLQLATVSMVLGILIGGLAGIISALKPYTIFDHVAMIIALLGVSMPAFWFGLMLMLVFAVMLGWLPATGIGTPQHLVLPSLVLGYTAAGIIARQTRSAMLDVMRQDYITTARAKGLSEHVVASRHALKNALIPVVTIVGLIFGTMLGGSVIVESVFSWPGMGKMLVDSILARDYPMIQAAVMVFAVSFALVNLVVDVLYAFLDPRIHYD
jgi:ABC-type dipeptide/oligopeptide/nickel transport system permease component